MPCRSLAVLILAGAAGTAVGQAPAPTAADKELVVRLDCLGNMPGPRPGIASRAYRPFLGETREWLAAKDAQDALVANLPTLTTRQLVTLWDVLWFPTDPSPNAARPKDLDAIAPGLSARVNAAALAALAAEQDPSRRRLFINMVKLQPHTLTDRQKADLKAAEEQPGR
jgi:hypothetical protein